MRKFTASVSLLALLILTAPSVFALDPVAPRSFRPFGMMYVKTPHPPTDTVTIVALATGERMVISSEKIEIVKVGDYNVEVKMQDYNYSQKVLVSPTERTDVIVPGFGNMRVNSPFDGTTVEVINSDTKKSIAKFPANEVKTLPRAHYDVKIKVGKYLLTKDRIWVVTNTTRELDVIPGTVVQVVPKGSS